MYYVKEISEGKTSELTHYLFIKYSLGEYEKEPVKVRVTSNKIKVSGPFGHVNPLHTILAGFAEGDILVKGSIVTSNEIEATLKDLDIEPTLIEKVRAKKAMRYVIDTEMSPEKYQKLTKAVANCMMLFNASDSEGRICKVKKDSPPSLTGKTKGFVRLELLKQDWERFKGEFLFDAPESKSYDIIHEYIINDIHIPKEYENDAIMARKMAVRKGTLKRKIDTGSNIIEKEYKLEA